MYVALHEVTECMVVGCTQNTPRLFIHVESHASTVSLLKSGEECHIKAINKTKQNLFFV